ncbi:aminotransferase class V-fold PLP-dependent enzyme [Paenarthrobacter nicotinovorans]|uniref:aminotransferase class V-fold PLP-dependent enzyme n=1 Tax=Paenarthrobacter nicotinovorans TaxID=29320 RepID=UPI0021B254E7|nr:aminotransferase class V-fold PLP-dependent enzyme [Paenarthrobacter nicotinovorans]
MIPAPLTVPRPMLTPEGQPAMADWSLTPSKVHLNHGSYGSVPRAAQAEQLKLKELMDLNPCPWFMNQFELVATARRKVAAFLSVDPQHLALVHNASAGVSTVYNSLDFAPGAEIVTTNHAYGAVLQGAERIARRCGGHVRIAEIPLEADAETACDLVMAEVTPRTALIVVDQITSATARAFPVEDIARAASVLGVPVLVDAAHAPGVLEFPVPDFEGFWVGNLHKFACAPRGTAALVARGPQAESLQPLIDSWGFPYTFPENFDHVGTQDVTSWMAAGTAFDTIEERYGWGTFRNYAKELCDYGQSLIGEAFTNATGRNAAVDVGMPVGPLRLIRLPDGLATTHEDSHTVRGYISEHLDIETAITTFNGQGYLRLSAHLYNSPKDYEIFAEKAVPELVRLARSL